MRTVPCEDVVVTVDGEALPEVGSVAWSTRLRGRRHRSWAIVTRIVLLVNGSPHVYRHDIIKHADKGRLRAIMRLLRRGAPPWIMLSLERRWT